MAVCGELPLLSLPDNRFLVAFESLASNSIDRSGKFSIKGNAWIQLLCSRRGIQRVKETEREMKAEEVENESESREGDEGRRVKVREREIR